MIDYKRLTVKRADGEPTVRSNITIQVLINRLAKLEDEIEDETLVELPCKEGDIVYFVNRYRPTLRIETFKVDHLEVKKNYIRAACYDFENEDDCSMYRIDSKDISFSKEEAEEALKKYKKLKRT